MLVLLLSYLHLIQTVWLSKPNLKVYISVVLSRAKDDTSEN